jgi:hypothetical protein
MNGELSKNVKNLYMTILDKFKTLKKELDLKDTDIVKLISVIELTTSLDKIAEALERIAKKNMS